MIKSNFTGICKTIINVQDEINRQDLKWGADRRHNAAEWMQILTEEVGEAATDGNAVTFDGASTEKMEIELVQVAAVAIQAATALRRTRLLIPAR